MKVDIEGAESMLIQGMRLSFARFQIPHVVCETHEGSEVFRAMIELGYKARPLCIYKPQWQWGNWIFELA